MAKKPKTDDVSAQAVTTKAPTKLTLLLTALGSDDGASIPELMTATGWQAHSVRGAIAGTLRKKGHATTSEVINGVRRYRLASGAQ